MTILDRLIALTLPLVPKPIVRKVSSRYIAGETAADALRVAESLNARGIRATMDILGEDIHQIEQARRAHDDYMQLLDEIHSRKVDSNVSVKPSQFRLQLDKAGCVDLVDRLVRHARELNNFVRIDMEDSSCTSDTLQVYRELRRQHSNVGVVIQAYLRRTMSDIAALQDVQPNFRLCKGVY